MSGELKGVTSAPIQGSRSATTKGSGRAGGGTRAGGAGDRVSITDTAINLGNIERTLAQIPVVNGSAVDAIRESLAEGTYVINPKRIADRLIEFELIYNRAERRHGQINP